MQLNPAIIKMPNAPNFVFPTPLSFPIEQIAIFAPFDLNTKLTLT
ncbi:MnxE [Paenibacillus algicola]|uniref:MnxE n=1 Tax=Paenibacillus algicola TaxID=2565926 RepID=A0A4P8XJX4_9BACL|nr:MnxE [Paenibacillus algicola]